MTLENEDNRNRSFQLNSFILILTQPKCGIKILNFGFMNVLCNL